MSDPKEVPKKSIPSADAAGRIASFCDRCRQKIYMWHCQNRGCRWCALCGSRTVSGKGKNP